MARLSLATRNRMRRRKIVVILSLWLNIMHIVNWFFIFLHHIVDRHNRQDGLRPMCEEGFYKRRAAIHRLVYDGDETCLDQLRMNRQAFTKLCSLLQTIGKLEPTEHMLVDEQVAMSLNVLAHHAKNQIRKYQFWWSGGIFSRHFSKVLNAIIRLHEELLKKSEAIPQNSTDQRWKWFKGCLGALDGTHIRVKVPLEDELRYRTRKNEIATKVLGVCSPNLQFIYVLPGWEGSAADGRVLRDAIGRHGFEIPRGHYYLVDAVYPNGEGFLAPYRGWRYHLKDWSCGRQPTTAEELFNMRHSAARNVIERCFGLLKMRWSILENLSFYPIKATNLIIIACCLLHNFIRQEMPIDPLADEVFEEPTMTGVEGGGELITGVQTSKKWTTFRDNLARDMFNEWKAGGH